VRQRDIKRRDARRKLGFASSGRFVLRLDPALHARLRDAARQTGTSLNAYCADRLARSHGSGLSTMPDAVAVTARAVQLFGDRLVAVAAYGSWARGDAVAASDVDLLIVLEPDARLGRELYRRWDEEPMEWSGRTVEPHFVTLAPPDRTVAGVWAEVALDGIVLLDPELRLSARLVQVRHDIVAGRIVRRLSHGQPYWVIEEVARGA
jgi:predicted nucleotidyltransferase